MIYGALFLVPKKHGWHDDYFQTVFESLGTDELMPFGFCSFLLGWSIVYRSSFALILCVLSRSCGGQHLDTKHTSYLRVNEVNFAKCPSWTCFRNKYPKQTKLRHDLRLQGEQQGALGQVTLPMAINLTVMSTITECYSPHLNCSWTT